MIHELIAFAVGCVTMFALLAPIGIHRKTKDTKDAQSAPARVKPPVARVSSLLKVKGDLTVTPGNKNK